MKKTMFVLAVVVVLAILSVVFLAPNVKALQLDDNFFFTIPEDTEVPAGLRCMNVILPDNSGNFMPDLEQYVLTTNTEWASVSYRIITTDNNNTVIIPICYSRPGESLCSDPYVISITTTASDLEKTYNGGVCVSGFSDVDIVSDDVITAAVDNNQTPMDVINSNVDLFDVGFEIDTKTVSPGEPAQFTMLLESHASLEIDLYAASSSVTVQPQSTSLSTNASDVFKEVLFTAVAPQQPGTYSFDVVASVRGCNMSFCSREATATVVVGQAGEIDTFTVNLFPTSINIRELRPILYRFTIDNRGPARDFYVDMELPAGLTTTFLPTTINVGENSFERISFTVMPRNVSSFYQFTVSATNEDNTKPATSYISTNEMLTDAARAVKAAEQTGDPGLAANANNALDEWMRNYNTSRYGQDLGDYKNFRDSLNSSSGDSGGPGHSGDAGMDMGLVIIIIVIVAVLAALGVFAMRKRSSVVNVPEF